MAKSKGKFMYGYCVCSAVLVTGWLLYAIPKLFIITASYVTQMVKALIPYGG